MSHYGATSTIERVQQLRERILASMSGAELAEYARLKAKRNLPVGKIGVVRLSYGSSKEAASAPGDCGKQSP